VNINKRDGKPAGRQVESQVFQPACAEASAGRNAQRPIFKTLPAG